MRTVLSFFLLICPSPPFTFAFYPPFFKPMKKKYSLRLFLAMSLGLTTLFAQAQERRHSEKFEQFKEEWRSPNTYRTGSGAPGHEYWQNTADYKMEIALDDEKQSITGRETITYTNNSPDVLRYLWLQLDQNVRAENSHAYQTSTQELGNVVSRRRLGQILGHDFDGGHKIQRVGLVGSQDTLPYTINETMMIVDLPAPLKPGEKFTFEVKWNYNIQDRMRMGGRSGYEYFEEDDNYLYTIAQFFPRMCVYTDYDGWQNKQFLGSGEFTVPFGSYEVALTLPEDILVAATGELQNAEDVLTATQLERLNKAKNTFDKPVIIVTQEEATKQEKSRSKKTKTWVFKADSVRDFGFAASRKFIWDAMAVKLDTRTTLAQSFYPKEGNPLWEEFSTLAVAQTLETYSKHTFDYPYPHATSVHAAAIGMEYPMICFNFGRPDKNGKYSNYIKERMIGVIIHEVGHNFFPMIVNSDERQWTWMDEGLNTFTQTLAEEVFPPVKKPLKVRDIVPYMSMEKHLLSPIMTNSEQVQNLGPNAYSKPATALTILRRTVMGPELFDRAFKEYANRWKFKHPTPEDFFRTMQDASGVDLDWFWRGWFYGVDHVDVALTGVRWFRADGYEGEIGKKKKKKEDGERTYKTFMANLDDQLKAKLEANLGMNFYEVSLENVGGLVMPVILEFEYEDGEKERIQLPAEVWRKNDQRITKVFARKKVVKSVTFDPYEELADTNTDNNLWPRNEEPERFAPLDQK